MRKIILFLICLAVTVTLFSCVGNNYPCQHIDGNLDGKCDKCEREISAVPEEKITLIAGGEANFQFVLPQGEGFSVDVLHAVDKVIRDMRSCGVKVERVEDKESTVQNIEVLVGQINTRGEKYDFDEHTLGIEGYAVTLIDTKVVISGGSESALVTAIGEFASKIIGITEQKQTISELTVTSDMEILSVQSNYAITSLKVNGNDLSEYTLAADLEDENYVAAAKYVQIELYLNTGRWLDIVDLSDASKSVVIKSVSADSLPDGFQIKTDKDDNLIVECAYGNMLEKSVKEFVEEKIVKASGDVVFSGTVFTKNISVLCYDDFGAAGDGVTDDFFAIKETHDTANECGQMVMATPGKTYLIRDTRDGEGNVLSVIIKTDTVWTGANFIIDDTNFSTFDGTGVAAEDVFIVSPDVEMYKITSQKYLESIVAAGLGRGTTHIDIPDVDYPVLIIPYNGAHNVYRRKGYGAFEGSAQHELIVLDENGNVDPETPVFFDYNYLTSIAVYRLECKPITIEGGVFTTRASHIDIVARDEYNSVIGTNSGYIQRGIEVQRPFTTVKNTEHYVTGEITLAEQASGMLGPAYNGFFCASFTHDVRFLNCVLTGRRCYRKNNVSDAGSGTSGTYDYSVHEGSTIVYENCTQSNFWITVDNITGEIKAAKEGDEGAQLSMSPVDYPGINFKAFWGLGGSNYTKNMQFINCVISRFDAHAGLVDGKIINSHVGELSLVGGGTLTVENTNIYMDGSGDCDSVVGLRSDYGATWDGDVILTDVRVHVDKSNDFVLVGTSYANWYYGYVCAFPSLTVDNIEIIYPKSDIRAQNKKVVLTNLPSEKALHLSQTANTYPVYPYVDKNRDYVVDNTNVPYDQNKISENRGGIVNSTTKNNLNIVKPPEYVKVLGNEGGYVFVIPDTSGVEVSDGFYYDGTESYGGFFGDTKFYCNENDYCVGTAGADNDVFTFK